jgi:hypothetical protein
MNTQKREEVKIFKAVYKLDRNAETYFSEIKQDIFAYNETTAEAKAEKNAKQFSELVKCSVNFVGFENDNK